MLAAWGLMLAAWSLRPLEAWGLKLEAYVSQLSSLRNISDGNRSFSLEPRSYDRIACGQLVTFSLCIHSDLDINVYRI